MDNRKVIKRIDEACNEFFNPPLYYMDFQWLIYKAQKLGFETYQTASISGVAGMPTTVKFKDYNHCGVSLGADMFLLARIYDYKVDRKMTVNGIKAILEILTQIANRK